MIPTMIKVSGGDASAAIATGQAVGAVGAVLIAYGWIVSGPAAVARVDAVGRRTEYLESLRTRLVICVPAAACALVAVLVVRTGQDLAALGSVSTATIGLTASGSSWAPVSATPRRRRPPSRTRTRPSCGGHPGHERRDRRTRSRGQRTPGLWAGSPARRVADIDGQWFDRADTHTKRIWIPDSDSVVENA